MKIWWILLIPILWGGCSKFVEVVDDSYHDVVSVKKQRNLSIVFGHNIEGETSPCGCRHFPLGGLDNVAGTLHQLKKKGPLIYIDTGDTFLSSSIISSDLMTSTKFTAETLALGLKLLKINFILPGEKDFALGASYLNQLAQKNDLTLLISNLSAPTPLKHIKYKVISFGPRKLFFIGLLSSSVFFQKNKAPPLITAQKALANILSVLEKKEGFKADDPNHLLIVLSHSGMNKDVKLANSFPQIDWILGAHTQSFTNRAVSVGRTNIVQAMSKNHYLGHLSIPASAKQKTQFKLIEIDEDKAKLLTPNPLTSLIARHKAELSRIQEKEQNTGWPTHQSTHQKKTRYKTYLQCMDCHQKQTQFWQQTAHALGYHTLTLKKSHNDTRCIPCHTLGFKDPMGFSKTSHLILSDPSKPANQKAYLNQLKESVLRAIAPSVRELSPRQRAKLSAKEIELAKKYHIDKNFSHIQCLHCHSVLNDHPFEMQESKPNKKSTLSYQQACLKCHTYSQSPAWYKKGQWPPKIELKSLKSQISQVACPLIDRN